ncbi:hypothetical protein [Streptomyces sp. NPDC008092]|uniref:hypothetical protein n=1 Tax=Streptomyces sp. NPDC008092 TaxID=3364808 RepID=UPI0036E30B91
MTTVLPAFVQQLLVQSKNPAEVPQIDPSHAEGWLGILASKLLSIFDTGTYRAGGSFLAHGYAHLLIELPDEPTTYLRVPAQAGLAPWPVLATSVVLTIAGAMELEMYQEVANSLVLQPHYARAFGPEQVFAVHRDTFCGTRSSVDALNLLTIAPPTELGGSPLTGDEYASAAHRAREILDQCRGEAFVKNTAPWLMQVPCLDMPDLTYVQHVSLSILDRLSADRNLLTTLVDEVLTLPGRLAASRVTLLLNRLSLWEAPDHSFEIRLNMNPRPENQLVPHDHCYAFATHVLTGGYVHVVRRRTDGWEGPFTGADLQPAIVTVERPGSAYALDHSVVHQAVMAPHTVTLFIRGPRRKASSHAAEDLMPPEQSWPEAAVPGNQPAQSRSATVDEYLMMRRYLRERRIIN